MAETARRGACVFGLTWGDEGKGKIVDLLCPAFDVVVRFNGGANAGHTVRVGSESFALHLLPTGVLRPGHTGVIGPGVVVDPIQLIEEIDGLAKRGIDVSGRLLISDRAHLVLPYHKLEDQLSEQAASGSTRIGTTARGIGPCYADKMKRSNAVRFIDLVGDSDLADHVRQIVAARKGMLTALYGSDGDLDAEAVLQDIAVAKDRLAAYVCDTTSYLHGVIHSGKAILFEGANGMLLDVDHGTYPFVTSSSTGPHGLAAGAGVPLTQVTRLIGTTKAYTTRVGSGPFVTELKDARGDRIREAGHEYGTTTGRPRRCGWFDSVACRYTARISGVTDIALMHLDTLSGFDEVGICVAYRLDGERISAPPASAAQLERVEPVIELVPGWQEDLRAIRRFEDLPATARDFVQRIESLVRAPVSIAGVGPDRAQTLVRGPIQDLINVTENQAV
ncbi:MAG: adenylosuccinate synthase [Phycisphaerales bacterium]|nr:MAG: adenylosuccinate synthase [Phycisphaerales bacterium]